MQNSTSSAQLVAESKMLQSLLANSYMLVLKTQNYHWNVVGSNFYSLHLLFEMQYKELFEACDKIAETIRTFGVKAFASFSKYAKLSLFKDGSENLDAIQMIEDLIESHEAVVAMMHKEYKSIKNPIVSALFDERLEAHEKSIWMLSSHLDNVEHD